MYREGSKPRPHMGPGPMRKSSDSKVRPELRDQELIKELSLMDDIFMNVCFSAEGGMACAELIIQVILGRSDIQIKELHTQHVLKGLHGRGVIFDIYAEDAKGRSYDIEIQRDERGAIPRRARYNASLMDASISRKGERHEEMREIYVIFITEEDIYGKGLPLYHVERKIKETDEEFNDGAHIIYVNGRYRGEDAIGRLIHDLGCSEPRAMNYRILSEQTGKFKGEQEKKEGGAMSRAVEEWKKEIREEALEEYRNKYKIELENATRRAEDAAKAQNLRTAREMLMSGGFSNEQIAKFSFLSLDEVKGLRQEIS